MGAIVGDIIGSRFEWSKNKNKKPRLITKKSHFTDDTVLTCAIAKAIVTGEEYNVCLREFTNLYPNAGYGKMYKEWAFNPEGQRPTNSYGNGAAMRLLAIPLYFDSLPGVLKEVVLQASYTHAHPDSLQSVMLLSHTIYLAKTIKDKRIIARQLNKIYGYTPVQPGNPIIRKNSLHSATGVCEALNCFFNNKDYASTIYDAINYGGDTDTIACMAGGLAYVFYEKMPKKLMEDSIKLLPHDLRLWIFKFSCETEG